MREINGAKTQSADVSGILDCKLIAVNKTDVYAIGGNKGTRTLLGKYKDWPKSCFKIDLGRGKFEKRGDMIQERLNFGICAIRHMIFVVGGRNEEKGDLSTTERYDMLENKWTELPCSIKGGYTAGLTVVPAKNRYIYGFGLINNSDFSQE